ncbi:hypothetical protein BD779DRAFT_1480179 [Infundibulicybe gibba]|nr:hypothetical protein BD779DRAFT_1480179 [Infundibulicybe gibba]
MHLISLVIIPSPNELIPGLTRIIVGTQETQETQLMEMQDGRNEGDGSGRRMEAESEVGEVWNEAGMETRICGLDDMGGATARDADGAWVNGDGLDNGGETRPVKNRAVHLSDNVNEIVTIGVKLGAWLCDSDGRLLVNERGSVVSAKWRWYEDRITGAVGGWRE